MGRRWVFVAMLVAAGGCAEARWQAAVPERPNWTWSVTGTVVSKTVPDHGHAHVRLRVEPHGLPWLPDGQTELDCKVDASTRDRFAGVLGLLRNGERVEICGYAARDTRSGVVSIRPVTSIDPWPAAAADTPKR